MIKIINSKSKYIGIGRLENSLYGYFQIYRKIIGPVYIKIHQE